MDSLILDDDLRIKLERCVELLGAYSSTVLTARLLAEATRGELTPSQLEALIFIQRHGGCSAKALSEGLHISIPSSTRLVDRMVRKGLVNRRESGVDRRLVHLTVTPTGETALRQVHDARLAQLRKALETLQPVEQELMLNSLEHFLQAALLDVRTVEDCCLHCGSDHEGNCVVNRAHIALAGRPIEHP